MNQLTRRQCLAKSAALMSLPLVHAWPTSLAAQATRQQRSANAALQIGCIGMRYQGTVIARQAETHGRIVAICDVDRHVREQARASFGSTPAIFEDYRDLLARNDIDFVTIGTPDHWHAKMLVDACRAGKDAYCEKPLTLTIAEGRTICETVKRTGRVVQVGSWQRSDQRFRLAVELVRSGRIGKLQRVDVVLGKNVQGGPFTIENVPRHFNWNLWQGQTPDVPYIPERSHYTFRWWYEYSGGQMTDWGAHHLDIAQWAIDSPLLTVSGAAVYPQTPNGYNVACDFHATYEFADGVTMTVSDEGRNGILFTGSEGRLFVNRGSIEGTPVERLADNPLRREDYSAYDHDRLDRVERVGKLDAIVNHMANFVDCLETSHRPISDVTSQHQSALLCHLGNIAMRVGRPLRWDASSEQIVDDAAANAMQSREVRDGYQVEL
ncbi:MAG: Gfo/Idh/MocA family oxidoreductase [Planctomycetales bacterium]|nr:Gfo/Idh/MocA family oxidoreductase [Planctomycetales bacterium]